MVEWIKHMRRIASILVLLVWVLLGISAVVADQGYSFTVKGVIKALPGNGRAANEILVKHEPIPNYRDEAGNVVGMMAMTMPFYLADVKTLEGLAVGDSVEMLIEQHLKPKFSENVVSIKRVSSATK